MAPLDKPTINIAARAQLTKLLIAFVFSIFIVRLWYLQILKGEYYREQSENNRLQTVFVQPPRGLILDRNGIVLARNRPSFNIELVPEDAPKLSETVLRMAELLNLDGAPLLERVKSMPRRRKYEPRIILKDVTRDQVATVMARKPELPGIIVTVAPARDYPFGTSGAHVLGYVREISKEQLERPDYSTYRMNDIIGQFGLEAKWERFLQGKRGIRRIIVNAVGTKIGDASSEVEVAGHTLTTTIDQKVQKAADDALQGKRGAIVALDAKTGEVLALTSAPSFDPNIFVSEVPSAVWRELNSPINRPLSNRAVQGAYPPGSVFKVWMGYAGLAEGVIGNNDGPVCNGGYPFAGRTYHCHKRSGHGHTDIYSALVQSCDVFFYVLGQRLGIDRIHQYSTMFGLGKPTGLDLAEESSGLVPSSEWKARMFKNPSDKRWYPGETLSVVIGQGATTTTPIQMARALAALVNGGNLLRPSLVKKIQSVDGSFSDDNFPIMVDEKIELDSNLVEIVKKAMVGVVNDPMGTGKKSSLTKELGITVGGKTGTAQVVSLDFHKEGTHFDHHAWFAGYAPAEDPKVVVVALVENGGHGGAAAAPMVKQVLEAYFGYVPPSESVDERKSVEPLPLEENDLPPESSPLEERVD